jgi:hypothetical protein
VAIAGWTALSWGGRISLLTGAERTDPWAWTRIGGSILIGLVVAGALLVRRWRWPGWLLAGWVTMIWGRSLYGVWTDPNTLGFRLVHTGLAAVWLALAGAAIRVGQAGSGTRPAGRGGPGGTNPVNRATTSSTDR